MCTTRMSNSEQAHRRWDGQARVALFNTQTAYGETYNEAQTFVEVATFQREDHLAVAFDCVLHPLHDQSFGGLCHRREHLEDAIMGFPQHGFSAHCQHDVALLDARLMGRG